MFSATLGQDRNFSTPFGAGAGVLDVGEPCGPAPGALGTLSRYEALPWQGMMERSPSSPGLPVPRSAGGPGGNGSLPTVAPAAAKAAISPSALVVAGAGVGAGLLVGLPVVAALVIGAGFWGIRVAAGAARAEARRRRADRPEVIDPYAVAEPWRSFVRESLTAQSKFEQAVIRSRPGPLRDRLAGVSARVHDGVREVWRVAHLGAALDAALAGLNVERTCADMSRLQEQPTAGLSAEALQAHRDSEAAMATQLQAARRVEAAARRATDRVRVLAAELNAAVAGAVELSLDGVTASEAATHLAGSVDSVVGEIEALRLALEETSGGSGRLRPSP